MSKKQTSILKLATRLLTASTDDQQAAGFAGSGSPSANSKKEQQQQQAGSCRQVELAQEHNRQVMLRQWFKICRKSSKPFSSS